MEKPLNTLNVFYTGKFKKRFKKYTTSIEVIGIDTEADRQGKCFMIATSENDVFSPEQLLEKLKSRTYRGKKFVAYNLKYDMGALLQIFPYETLQELRENDVAIFGEWTIRVIANKMISFKYKHHVCEIFDMYNFYMGSLNSNAKKYLGKTKIDLDPKQFTQKYIDDHWDEIALYCIHDAQLVKQLADILIKRFENFGVYPRKLYSVAYISYQHFRQSCEYPHVARYWIHHRQVLDYAMASYNGGKFEVTRKGTGYFYEYDIVSAYPYEIAHLIDISHARIVWSHKYRKYAVYGFIDCTMNLPYDFYSPVVMKRKHLNTYPFGTFRRVITKQEYEYLTAAGIDISIHNACWLHVDKKTYPFQKEVYRLVEQKQEYKRIGDKLQYHTTKILLNSLYGKFVQLIEKDGKWRASQCWNPIYGAVITANCRIRISQLQNVYDSIYAVHTDSVISSKPLPFKESNTLGDLGYETEGNGIIIGTGIYQIGDMTKFRGFTTNLDLFSLCDKRTKSIDLETVQARSWREIIFHGWEKDRMNRFEPSVKTVSCNFDKKRMWIDDWERFSDIPKRNVESTPLWYGPSLY